MRIIKKEMVYLSPNELDTLIEALRIFDGVKREASMPSILNDCEACTECISDFLGNYCGDDADFLPFEEYPNDLL